MGSTSTDAQHSRSRGKIVWAPQPGPQTLLLSCPVEDILFGGARGGGKSDALLGDWVAHASRSNGFAHGVIFRRTTPQLEEIIGRSKQIFPALGARWREQIKTWIFPCGSRLKMRWLDRDEDADNYQGHQYTWIGWDEMGNWPTPDPIDKLRATLRSPQGIRCVMRGSANPGGIGHQWLKERYIQPAPPLTPFFDEVKRTWRVFIPSKLTDNRKLLDADPTYMDRIRSSGPAWLVRAWLDGDWDASAGDSFFTLDILLEDGKPVEYPQGCDYVFATVDTAVKTGKKRDGTAVCFWAVNEYYGTPLILLDWEIVQIEGHLLDGWLPSIDQRLEELARETRARMGSGGCFIEDAQSGSILLGQAKQRNINATGIDLALTSKGKDERAMIAGPHVYRNKVKMSSFAHNKVSVYKGQSKNHLVTQVTGYRLGAENHDDDLLDTFAYGVIISLSSPKETGRSR